jgi:tetratricopeptide (TPR) repeat protein
LQQAWELVEPLDIVDVKTKLLNGLAVASCTEDNHEDTSSTLEKAIKLDGTNYHLWANAGLVQYLNGRTAQAIRNIEKAIRLHSTSARLRYILGYIHLCSGKYDKAESCFERAMELDDENFAACCGLAVCFIRQTLPDALDRISKLFLREDKTGTYHSICVTALLDNRAAAMNMLQQALAERRISLPFIRHDPTLHLIFDGATLNSLER